MNSSWEPIIVKTHRGQKSAFASIGNGKIGFSQYACNLMNNPFQYNFVRVGKKHTGNEILIGFEFIKNDVGTGTYVLSRKRHKNKKTGRTAEIGGFEITNSTLAKALFGDDAMGKTKRYRVTLDNYNDKMLIIHVPKQ
jgi:hypothetical protein